MNPTDDNARRGIPLDPQRRSLLFALGGLGISSLLSLTREQLREIARRYDTEFR